VATGILAQPSTVSLAGILSTIAVKELMEDPMVFCVCVLNSRSMSPAAKVFVDAIVDFCQRYTD
jgi:hypothetical protein